MMKMDERNDVTYIYRGGKRKFECVFFGMEEGFEQLSANVSTVEVDLTTTIIEDYSFYGCRSLRNVSIPSNVTAIGVSVFENCFSLTSITLPSSVTTLGDSVFSCCSSLSTIVLPSSITNLGDSIFKDCISLTSMILPPTITTLGYDLFKGCSSLTSVTLPTTITTLRAGVFAQCSSLTSIDLPTTLTAISLTAFEGCFSLASLKTSSFSTTGVMATNSGRFKDVLVEAGFSPVNPSEILYGYDKIPWIGGMYYDINTWAKTRGEDGRSPLCTAAEKALKWVDMKVIFAGNMPAIHEVDTVTGLPLFMLAAVGSSSDMESVYHLLKEFPSAIDGC